MLLLFSQNLPASPKVLRAGNLEAALGLRYSTLLNDINNIFIGS
jgi:hypothetical protein